MRAFLPTLDNRVDLHAFYAAGWIETGGLRVNFVASVDGAAQADGRSRGLQTAGDNKVYAALRDLADVVLVGAGTARIEGYRPARISPEQAGVRHDFGLRPVLPVAVLSRTLRLDPHATLFADADPAARPLVLTCESAPADRAVLFAPLAEVVVCGTDTIDLKAARQALADRGLIRILSEGGPTTFAQLAAQNLVDEVCLSITPMLIGPGPGRIIAGDLAHTLAKPLELVGVLEEDGALFLRYRTPPLAHLGHA